MCIGLPEPADGDEDNDAASVAEGKPATYKLIASRAPTTDLTVLMSVATTGGPFTNTPGNIEVTFKPIYGTTVNFPIPTIQDLLDEHNGAIKVTLEPNDGYVVHSTLNMASVTVVDNDVPATPTNVRVNGHLNSDGEITLRWDKDTTTGAARFDARYVYETCDSEGCRMLNSTWTVEPVKLQHSVVANTTEGLVPGLTEGRLQRIELQAKNVDVSEDWSVFQVVYPTAAPKRVSHWVGTVQIDAFRTDGFYDYEICVPPNDVSDLKTLPGTTVRQLTGWAASWSVGTKWQRNNLNIIRLVGTEVNSGCFAPMQATIPDKDQAGFWSDDVMNAYCPSSRDRGCYVQRGTHTKASAPSFIAMRKSAPWDRTVRGCKLLESTWKHEIGHPFGLGHGTTPVSIMTPLRDNLHTPLVEERTACTPSKWDAAVILSIYQSR